MGAGKRPGQSPSNKEAGSIAEEEVVVPAKGKKRSLPAEEEQEATPVTPKNKKPKAEKSAEDVVSSPDKPQVLKPNAFRSLHSITSQRQEQTLPDPVQSFDEAPFGKKVRTALKEAGFPAPSPIQAQSWPVAVEGSDLVAVAKTGSGKTLAFLLPAFRLVSAAEDAGEKGVAKPPVLVLAPTRELAVQIEAECVRFGRTAKVRSQVVFGGAPKGPQAKALKELPQVLVATPGRLQDLMSMGVVSLSKVALLVLDEADRMLDMGFEPEIAKILGETPAERQTLLFTATWPKAVQRIAAKYLKEDFVHINVGQTEELAANKAVSQEFFRLDDDQKEDKLWRILDGLADSSKLICFANTKRRIEGLSKSFWAKGYSSASLHGDKAQWERDRDLAEFAEGRCWLLFATDVCSRGLDIRGVTHVVNFDMARDVESYVHRIGRTGRAGATGTSITFWNEAYDMECAPALVKIAKEAGQEVPDWLDKAAAKQKQVKNKAWRY